MGRGKIEIRRIDNDTNRNVTYSKRRSGIIKKARELTVLCDATVSLIMFSNTDKISEYCSHTTTLKRMYDRYQEVSRINLWDSIYEKMERRFKNLKEINENLRKGIRKRRGEDLNDLNMNELQCLEQDLEASLRRVREGKYHEIEKKINTARRKEKSQLQHQVILVNQLQEKIIQEQYGGINSNDDDYENAERGAGGRSFGRDFHDFQIL